MKRLLAATMLIPSFAHAEQTSIICKTKETNEYIDIVSTGKNTNDVLLQVQGGKFYDGVSSFNDPIFKVIVPFDTGSAILVYNFKTNEGAFALSLGKDIQTQEVFCAFR